jgi:hypothetical protein
LVGAPNVGFEQLAGTVTGAIGKKNDIFAHGFNPYFIGCASCALNFKHI